MTAHAAHQGAKNLTKVPTPTLASLSKFSSSNGMTAAEDRAQQRLTTIANKVRCIGLGAAVGPARAGESGADLLAAVNALHVFTSPTF